MSVPRAVLDTNVVISGIFFGGVPGRILTAWQAERFALAASPAILTEYRRVAAELASRTKPIAAGAVLDVLTIHAEIVEDQASSRALCRDPHDDKFLLCAAAARAVLVSGDRDLLTADGVLGVRVITPRAFLTSIGAG